MDVDTQVELERFSTLVDLIYKGATDLHAWQKVPHLVREWIGTRACLIFTPFHTPDKGGFILSDNLPQQFIELWSTKFQPHDIWGQRADELGLLETGNVLRDQDLVPQSEFLSSTIWNEFLHPYQISRLLTGVVFSSGDNSGFPVVCTCLGLKNEPYKDESVHKMDLLVPHLSRALGVMFKLRDAEFKVASSLEALNRLSGGVLLFDADGSLNFVNHSAKKILQQEDGLYLRREFALTDKTFLLAADRQYQTMLDEAIRDAISLGITTTRHFSWGICIPRPSGRPPVKLSFSTLPRENEFGSGRDVPCAIAFLNEGDRAIALDQELLSKAYGLTKAEIRLAALMVEGFSMDEVVVELGISINTVKTQLKLLYEKTNTNNRVKLVKTLISMNHP